MSEAIKENRIVPMVMLYPHPRNYRQHPPSQITNLKKSLERFGQGRSIVCQEHENGSYTIVAGHGIYQAADELGYRELRADILPKDWTEAQVQGYLVADNLHSADATDDDELLAALLQEQKDVGYDLASLGSSDETLRQMLESLGDGYLGAGDEDESDEEEDEIPENVEVRAKPGDIWQLGRHRVMCADSSSIDNINALVGGTKIDILHGDPPYGINLLSKRGALGKSKDYNPIIGDDKPFEPAFYLKLAPVVVLWGAIHFAHKLPSSPFWLVWDKQGGAKDNTFASCELAWCNAKQQARVLTHIWDGFRRDSERGEDRSHPNQKPVAVIEWVLDWLEGDVVLEPFLGSGSTLLACERMGKQCFGLELDPRYIDVVLARWENHTGEEATLLEHSEEVAHA